MQTDAASLSFCPSVWLAPAIDTSRQAASCCKSPDHKLQEEPRLGQTQQLHKTRWMHPVLSCQQNQCLVLSLQLHIALVTSMLSLQVRHKLHMVDAGWLTLLLCCFSHHHCSVADALLAIEYCPSQACMHVKANSQCIVCGRSALQV